jgi:protein-L-isoaspartate(D-aspartate) O-methyltransferase
MRSAVWLVAALALFPSAQSPSAPESTDRVRERAAMVAEQIAGRGVKDPSVLRALREVPRHLFVPPASREHAYEDRPLPIGYGQTISQPFIVAYMTEALGIRPTDRVLEIGTGSGYQAAILGRLAREVWTIEIVPELGTRAATLLKDLKYTNVTVRVGDGYGGWAERAPFDRIIVTAAPDHVPEPLLQQLATGGRMVIPVGQQGGIQELLVIEKTPSGMVQRKTIPVLFVPLTRKQIE